MRKIIILFLLSFFIPQFTGIEVYAGLAAESGLYVEKEKIDPNLWDFGKVKAGEILKHDFVLKNETNDIMEINSVNSSCGCTGSEADKKSLNPQESTMIKVTFNSKGFLGSIQQFVYVNTNNADLSVIKFTIKAEVEKGG